MKISKREKIILGLTLLALIYAGTVLLFPGHRSTVSQLETEENSTQGLLAEVFQSLARHNRTETEQIILEKAQLPWPSAPFIPAGLSSAGKRTPEDETAEETVSDKFSYTGYVEVGKKRLAIINGEEYETGDRVTGSLFTVRNISPKNVHLGDAENRVRVIPMADGSLP